MIMYTATLKKYDRVIATKQCNSYREALIFERDAPYLYGLIDGLKHNMDGVVISIIKNN